MSITFGEGQKTKQESVLQEAERITSNDRNEQYGDARDSFQLYADICYHVFGLEIDAISIVQVMQSVKLGRNKYKYKRDNLVDLCGYAKLESIIRGGNEIQE